MVTTKDMAILLEDYSKYLECLASTQSPEIFTNGGKEHASILMSTMLKHTESEAKIFCEGFKPELIMTEPYQSSLKEYLKSNKILKVLIENDNYINESAFKLLREAQLKRNDNSIEFRLIKREDRKNIFDELSSDHCNFSIFDDNKFRLEINPAEYKAIGSFNSKERAEILIKLFNKAFNNAQKISN